MSRLPLLRSTALLAAGLLAAACAPGTDLPTAAPAPSADLAPTTVDTLRIGYFSKMPVVAFGKSKGFFAEQGIVVVDSITASSPQIFQALRDGRRDIIMTQVDNVFNYRYNASNPLGGTFDATAIFATDWGNGAALMARPGFTADSVRGKNVIVDSPNSGLAFVLYGVLRSRYGLEKGVDYKVVVTGGTPFRYADLLRGYSVKGTDTIPVAATILNAGYEYRAADAGMARLGGVRDAASPFLGGSAVARQAWLDTHDKLARRYIRAFIKAQQYVLDPANKDEVLAWLRTDANGSESVAQGTYAVLVTPGDGLIPDGRIDTQALYGTAALRDSFGGFDTPMDLNWLVSEASGVYNLSYWQKADVAIEQH